MNTIMEYNNGNETIRLYQDEATGKYVVEQTFSNSPGKVKHYKWNFGEASQLWDELIKREEK